MKKLVLKLIKFYRKLLSPGRYNIKICRFKPSCSEYMYVAIEVHGLFKGGLLGVYRVLRCNPFSKRGYDPVPGSLGEII